MPSNTKTELSESEIMQAELDALDEAAPEAGQNSVMESDTMQDTTLELVNTPSLDVSKWTWKEDICNLDDEFKNESGNIAVSKPGFEENHGEIVLLGNKSPFAAKRAVTAFSAIRQGKYKLVTTGLVVLDSEAESNDAIVAYATSKCSGQAVIDGELVDIPVPDKRGISFLMNDPVFGYAERYFVDLAWAHEVISQPGGEKAMTEKQVALASAFWKVYAAQAFVNADTVKIHVGKNSLPYVRKVLVNVDDPVASKEAMDAAQFADRQYKRDKKLMDNPTEDGSLPTKTGVAVKFDHTPKLVVVETVGRELTKVAILGEDKLDEATFIESDVKEVAVIERTEEGFGRSNIRTKVTMPAQLATIYNIAAKNGHDLAILS